MSELAPAIGLMLFARLRSALALGLSGLLSIAVTTGVNAVETRTSLTAAELLEAESRPVAPVRNESFLPVGLPGPPHHEFSGRLVLSAEEMRSDSAFASRAVLGRDPAIFPGVSIGFFTLDGELVPTTQDIIQPEGDGASESFWQIIVQPGRAWSESGDDGWSRASFPFALMNRMENETHNGVATFLYYESEVSRVRFQIVQQTAPYYIEAHFTAWGQLPARYEPVPRESNRKLMVAREEERANAFPVADWSVLEEKVGQAKLAGFDGRLSPDFLVMSALVYDGVLYHKPSNTRLGEYPYPRSMRYGVWSVTKSIGPGLGMLRLAQKYGPRVFDLRIKDYVAVESEHDGWDEVTFGDALNMATGLGGGSVTTNPNDMYVDYGDSTYDAWYTAPSAKQKIAKISKVGNYPWGPGEVARYRDRDTFVLGAAMDSFLKSVKGPGADIWTMIADEVLRPVHIYHAPMNRTIETDGSRGLPMMAWGWYPTLDDLAKVADLLHRRGHYGGEQILHHETTAALFSADGSLGQGSSNRSKFGEWRYKLGYHYVPYRDESSKALVYFPFMAGWIGNRVVLLPGGMTAIRISKAWPAPLGEQRAAGDPSAMIDVAIRLRPLGQ